MTKRVRESIGGVCIALALALVGLALGGWDGYGALVLFAAGVIGVVSLLNIGLDLMGVGVKKSSD